MPPTTRRSAGAGVRLEEAVDSLTRATGWPLATATGRRGPGARRSHALFAVVSVAAGGCLLAEQAFAAIRINVDAGPRVALARFFADNFAVQAAGLERTVVEGAAPRCAAPALCRVEHRAHAHAVRHPPRLSQTPVPLGHPERPDRLRAIDAGARGREVPDPSCASRHRELSSRTIALRHPMDYVMRSARRRRQEGLVQLDADTSMSPGTFEAALRAAGGAVHAVDEVIRKRPSMLSSPPARPVTMPRRRGRWAFACSTMPRSRRAMRGQRHGVARAAVVDFDVHHGNGSQEIFWSDKTVMYCSTHQMPLYPGTGAVGETGEFDTVVNAPLRPGDGGEAFRAAFEDRILPRLLAYAPELIIFPPASMPTCATRSPTSNLVEADFAWATQKIMDVADRCADGRIVSLLEGG